MDKAEKKKSLKLLFLILERGKGDDAAEFLENLGFPVCYHFYGRGTAHSDILNLLGLGDSQKDMLLTVVPSAVSPAVLTGLNVEFGLDNEGGGIAFTVKLNSVAGVSALRFLSWDTGEENPAGGDRAGGTGF